MPEKKPTKCGEVGGGAWHFRAKEAEHNAANGLATHSEVHVDLLGDLCLSQGPAHVARQAHACHGVGCGIWSAAQKVLSMPIWREVGKVSHAAAGSSQPPRRSPAAVSLLVTKAGEGALVLAPALLLVCDVPLHLVTGARNGALLDRWFGIGASRHDLPVS